MKVRILTGILIAFVIAIMFLTADTVFFNIIFAVLAALAVFEMSKCVGTEHKLVLTLPAYIISVGFPILAHFVKMSSLPIFFAALYVYLLYLLTVSTFSHGKYELSSVGMLYFTEIYILIGVLSLMMLKYLSGGKYLFAMTILVPVVTDVMAYFVGVTFGKHKLIPDVSPKKTVEGSVGGTVFGVAIFSVGGLFINRFIPTVNIELSALVLIGLIISIISQIGDLVASHIKRHFGIKDYGFILPGHGGVVDRLDSVIAVAPLVFFLCYALTFFGTIFAEI
ncbi:MAG: phosphatidate cytidylyltransferase [Clostridia bacterium]|nr:phosphatidate cytidylyltransferase [Clostridia bacterium]